MSKCMRERAIFWRYVLCAMNYLQGAPVRGTVFTFMCLATIPLVRAYGMVSVFGLQ